MTTSEPGRHKRAVVIHLTIALVLVCWIAWRTQQVANRQQDQATQTILFAEQTQVCLHELANALKVREEITETSDRLNNDQHRVLREMIAETAAAPADQSSEVLTRYLPIIAEAQQRQEELLHERGEHPIPDPVCPAIANHSLGR